MESIFDLKHELKLIKGKRVMVCIEHFCDIDGMTEYEYLKAKKNHKPSEVNY